MLITYSLIQTAALVHVALMSSEWDERLKDHPILPSGAKLLACAIERAHLVAEDTSNQNGKRECWQKCLSTR